MYYYILREWLDKRNWRMSSMHPFKLAAWAMLDVFHVDIDFITSKPGKVSFYNYARSTNRARYLLDKRKWRMSDFKVTMGEAVSHPLKDRTRNRGWETVVTLRSEVVCPYFLG